MVNTDIVNDFRTYQEDPARWVDRYLDQCRFHHPLPELSFPVEFDVRKELYYAKGKTKTAAREALGEVPVRDN